MGVDREWLSYAIYDEGNGIPNTWLTTDPIAATGPSLLRLQVNATDAPAGIYTGRVAFALVQQAGDPGDAEVRFSFVEVAMEVIAPSIVVQPNPIVADV